MKAKRKEKENDNKMEERVRGKGKKMEPYSKSVAKFIHHSFFASKIIENSRKVAVSDQCFISLHFYYTSNRRCKCL